MPAKQSPEFAVWDVTSPIDSIDFIKLMRGKLGWRNLLEAWTGKHIHRPDNQSIFMPCGDEGKESNPQLFKEASIFQEHLFAPNHGTGRDPALLYVSGHGIPGFIFSDNTEAIPIVNSSIIGEQGDSGTISPPKFKWSSDQLKYVILSACRQLTGKPQQALWARAMRSEKPLHGILGYRDSAPVAGKTGPIITQFVKALVAGKSILDAWKAAHHDIPSNWAAIIYKEALKDSAVQWTRDGHLMCKPSPQDRILYFDSKTYGKEVEVEEPKKYFDIKLARPQETFLPGQTLPMWTGVMAGNFVWIGIELTEKGGRFFESGDRIWISAAQVRPNYHPPFDIRELFSIYLPKGETLEQHQIKVTARIHDRQMFKDRDDLDTYEFTLPKINGTKLNQKWLLIDNWLLTDINQPYRELYIPIKIGKAGFLYIQYKNSGRLPLPLFYLMGQIKKKNGISFGIPDIRPTTYRKNKLMQEKLIDDFQFAVFVLLGALPKGEIFD